MRKHPHAPMEFCSCRSGEALASTSNDNTGLPRAIRTCANARLKWAFEALSCRLLKGSERKLLEIKLDRLIDDMRLLRSQMIAFDRPPERDRSLSQAKRTTAREQIE